MSNKKDHISVCICSYKRPILLRRLLKKLKLQKTYDRFIFSIVVADNDKEMSAKQTVENFKKECTIDIYYCLEPNQNIAMARNKTVENAKGNFIAFIDDDEFPDINWLYTMYETIQQYKVDGVLAPVRAFYEKKPPEWIKIGKFYEKEPNFKTGLVLEWTDTRTSNVLLKRDIFIDKENRFDPKYGRGGEDRDFFKRMIKRGKIFIWSSKAPVFESVPPERCKRSFMIRRALLRGTVAVETNSISILDMFKSFVACVIYIAMLPCLLFIGHHHFMKYLIKIFEHLGKLFKILGFDIIKQKYVIK